MEITHLLPTISLTSFPFSNRFKINPLRRRTHPKFPPPPPLLQRRSFSISYSFRTDPNLQISRQRSKRRNSLRKKLEQEKVLRKPKLESNNFQNPVDKIESNNLIIVDSSSSSSSTIKSENERPIVVGDSVLWNELENWADQYKTEVDYWGIGSAPIFTVFQDSNGTIKSVSFNEDEILRRSGIEPLLFRKQQLEGEDLMVKVVNSKLSRAKSLAREIETGEFMIPKNSTITEFVVAGKQSGFTNAIPPSVTIQPNIVLKLSRIGIAMVCGWFVYGMVKKILFGGDNEVELNREEKEMLRRKMKSRMEQEKMKKGAVEVIPRASESLMEPTERPLLDKQELMNKIMKAKDSANRVTSVESADSIAATSRDFDDKIEEIKVMARKARELERQEKSRLDENKGDEIDEFPSHMEEKRLRKDTSSLFLSNLINEDSGKSMDITQTINSPPLDVSFTANTEFVLEASPGDPKRDSDPGVPNLSSSREDQKDVWDNVYSTSNVSSNAIPLERADEDKKFRTHVSSSDVIRPPEHEEVNEKAQQKHEEQNMHETSMFEKTSDANSRINSFENSSPKRPKLNGNSLSPISSKVDDDEDYDENDGVDNLQSPQTSRVYKRIDPSAESVPVIAKESWMEKNFQEFEPIVKKIGVGFRENYMVAKEKVQEELNLKPEITLPVSDEDNDELEWMKNDGLREIVFQVRENELMGRDPFHMMDAADKRAFFEGLEKKVEKQNMELSNLHEYIHSRVENLDYGADGISLYDPPEKIIPRWKGPSVDKKPEIFNNFVQENKEFFAESMGISSLLSKPDTSEKSGKPPANSTSSPVNDLRKTSHEGASMNSKTVIDCSDGSSRAAKKSGKEYWQHTKKWSREFLEAYNAEADPEVKSIMKDMGKDLDRWITDKEVKETADLMTKIPEKQRKYIEKKLDNLKREMELFGPQAVVSKYREYAEEKEEDYLWWLDLPHVLCIELYTSDESGERVGFYSLEMAADLEIEPKPHHVITFEDPQDSKNFCYIIQAHMEMLGNGNAFVVPRPPKDAYREAQANGFGVTVIRKRELALNVDQTLEEVEEQISEIGSKVYHDAIMQERGVDIRTLMKGVFGSRKRAERRRRSRGGWGS